MPTGYTSAIKDGITFEEFVMSCARAFGALVTMRDEPHDAKIPKKFEPDDYHTKRLIESEKRAKELRDMTVWEAAKCATAAYNNRVQEIEKVIKERKELRAKYEAMLVKVVAWKPPTEDHVNLQNFMVEQITGSIDFDCNVSHYLENPPVKMDGEVWRREAQERVVKDIAYYKAEEVKEQQRAADQTRWVTELRRSLQK